MRETQINNHIRLRPADGDGPETQSPRKKLPLAAALGIALFFLFWLSLLFVVPWRQFSFTPAWVFENVRTRFGELYRFLFDGGSPFGITVFQYLAVMLAGAALSACGSVSTAAPDEETGGAAGCGGFATFPTRAGAVVVTSGGGVTVRYENKS